MEQAPVALVTGGSRRIGAAIVRRFHDRGYRVLIHCRNSVAEAESLAAQLNAGSRDLAAVVEADLNDSGASARIAATAHEKFGRIDVLVNNASGYFPTPFGEVEESDWEELQNSNLRGHFFLAQELRNELSNRRGSIINIVDVHAERPNHDFSAYAIAKAGLKAMTRALALELAPEVRVNAVAPGAILWPRHLQDESEPGVVEARQRILRSIPLGRQGSPEQVAECCFFLATEATYITGQTIRVDGGRFLNPV